MSERIELQKKARGQRPEYFADPAIDKVLSITMALAGETAVMRDRMDTIERLLEAGLPMIRCAPKGTPGERHFSIMCCASFIRNAKNWPSEPPKRDRMKRRLRWLKKRSDCTSLRVCRDGQSQSDAINQLICSVDRLLDAIADLGVE
jgi:hypothetical protein